MELFQQLQAFRVAHGLGNLADNKERERIAAFISPMDVVQFLTALSNGNITITEATEEKVVFIARGSSGETLDTSTRTLTSKGVTYDEAANWINKEENNINFDFLAEMAVKGYFADAVELYHHIMKVEEKDKNSKSEVINEH